MKSVLLPFFILSALNSYSQHTPAISDSKMSTRIDTYVKHLIKRQGIPGVALAIIKDKEAIYQNNIGYANIEHQVPVSDKSIFRLYSLTKPIICVAIFQLIENGKVSLDDFVSKYVFDLPESWNNIQIKHLLSHSSGLPDMAPLSDFKDLTEEEVKKKIFVQDFRFRTGDKYDYNQTGFWLLQKVIESITGEDLSTSIRKNQFNSSKNVFFSSDSRDIVANRTTPYFPFEKGTLMIDHSYLQGSYAHAKNGLNITLDEFIIWDSQLRSNKLLDEESMDSMWQTFPYTKSNKIFTYGWDKHDVNNHVSYGFSGSLCTAYRIFPNDNLSIIFLSNGLTNWYNIDNIVNHIASLVDEDILDINNLVFESLLKASFENGASNFAAEYQKLKKDPRFIANNFETHLNDVGYFWLLSLGETAKAIEVFELNTNEYPKSWNAHDSLAEAYAKIGINAEAIYNYKKSIHLNSDQEYKSKTNLKIKRLKE